MEGILSCRHGFNPVIFHFFPIWITLFKIFFLRDVWRFQFPLKQVIKIDVLEKPMRFYILSPRLKISKSFWQISSQQMLD